MGLQFQDLIYEKKDRIAYITINRPQVLNAVSPITNRELAAAIEDFQDDQDVWVAILTGAGDRAFSAGWDMKWPDAHPEEVRQWEEERNKRRRNHVYWHLDAMIEGDLPREIWKPIIAAVNGFALGGGMEMAMHCDMIIASENATFGQPEVTRGWPPGSGWVYLPRRIPLNVAMEMLMIGDRISAQRAYEVGLVNRVVPAAELMKTATAIAERLCENPPLAVQAVKQLVLRGVDMPANFAPLAWHLFSDSVHRVAMESEDREEGRHAFAEKRKAVFKGR